MIYDIWVFLCNGEEDEYKTNQNFIGMKYLFCGFIITNWYIVNFSTLKYTEFNRIINKYYMNYCTYCWKYWNDIANNSRIQKYRMYEWFKSEWQKALNSRFPQVRLYTRNKRVNLENCTNDYIWSWIYGLRKMKKNAENTNPKDIRSFM